MEQIQYYIGIIAVIVIGVFIIKKVASCLIRTVVIFLLLGALLFLCTLLGLSLIHISEPTRPY